MSTPNPSPRHPGRILDEDFLARLPSGTTQGELAERLEMSRPRLNDLLHGRRSVTVDTALRLARCFGTAPELWLQAQLRWDLHQARRARGRMREIQRIQPVAAVDAGFAAAPAGTAPSAAVPPGPAAPAEPRPPLRLVTDAEPPASTDRTPYYEEFLRRRGLLEEARRFARIQSQLDALEPRTPGARRRLQPLARPVEPGLRLPPGVRRGAAADELPAGSAAGIL